ncbi:3'-5' exonuclease [Vibrio europaeus]|uniref:3'-5' exonuclease n=1 Tax=Vibrio europaeus TaxID=300876 RepID=UPI003AA84975
MTVHKSKGLEFKTVFIMDLYQYIFPKYDFTTWEIGDYEQELNLLFVGITRAINHCFLITTASSLNSNLELKNGAPSVFMELPNIKGLSI